MSNQKVDLYGCIADALGLPPAQQHLNLAPPPHKRAPIDEWFDGQLWPMPPGVIVTDGPCSLLPPDYFKSQ